MPTQVQQNERQSRAERIGGNASAPGSRCVYYDLFCDDCERVATHFTHVGCLECQIRTEKNG
jgi:hypothetical protein